MSLAVAYGIQAGASILGGLFGKRAASKQARAARDMAQYNANVARMNAQSEAAAIEQQTKRLGKQQRELKAQQRMSVASRGGTLGGTDLLTLLDQAEQMQLDQLESIRQRDIALISGEQEAQRTIYSGQLQSQVAKAQGRAAMAKGILGAAGTLAGGFASGNLKLPSKPSLSNTQYVDPFESKTPTFQGKPYRG